MHRVCLLGNRVKRLLERFRNRQLLFSLLILLLLGFLLLGQAHAAVIGRLKDAEISNNNVINADDLDAEFNQLINESNSQDGRLDDLESENMSISGVKTFVSIPLLPASDPTTSNQAVRKNYVDSYLRRYNASDKPVYASVTTFTVASINCSTGDNSGFLQKTGSTTADLTSTGLNGIAQSSNLAATTVSVTNGSASVTFNASQNGVLVVGDVICTAGGQCRRLASGSGTSWTAESTFSSTESTVNVKRGGRAPSTWYYLYAVTNGTTPGLILSTRNTVGGDTLVDLPSGYSTSTARQFPFAVRTDTSSNIIPFLVSGWLQDTTVLFNTTSDFATAPLNLVTSSTNTAFTAADASALVPKISRVALLAVQTAYTSASGSVYVRPTGESHNGWIVGAARSGATGQEVFSEIPLSSSQSFDRRISNSGSSYIMDIRGFRVTEVP